MSNEATDRSDRFPELVGGGSAVMHIVALTVFGQIALENVSYGVVVGIFMGIGAYLFLPWFLRLSAVQEEATDAPSLSEVVRRADGNPQLGAIGLGLEVGGLAMLVAGFGLEEPDLLLGVGAAVAVALAVSTAASVLLRR